LTATIQIPSWLPSCASLYQSRLNLGITATLKAKKSTPQTNEQTSVSTKAVSIELSELRLPSETVLESVVAGIGLV